MPARILRTALNAASREIHAELGSGAMWADAHLMSSGKRHAWVAVDSSLGFNRKRHPSRGKSPRPATTIFVEVRR